MNLALVLIMIQLNLLNFAIQLPLMLHSHPFWNIIIQLYSNYTQAAHLSFIMSSNYSKPSSTKPSPESFTHASTAAGLVCSLDSPVPDDENYQSKVFVFTPSSKDSNHITKLAPVTNSSSNAKPTSNCTQSSYKEVPQSLIVPCPTQFSKSSHVVDNRKMLQEKLCCNKPKKGSVSKSPSA